MGAPSTCLHMYSNNLGTDVVLNRQEEGAQRSPTLKPGHLGPHLLSSLSLLSLFSSLLPYKHLHLLIMQPTDWATHKHGSD